MKHLIWKLIIPLTIISLALFTKEWEVLVDGDFKETLTGFPLAYYCPCWHTSLCLQIFVRELLINILAHFSFWVITIFFINQFFRKINPHKFISISLIAIATILLSFMILIGSLPEHVYSFERDFGIEVMSTNFTVF